MVNYCCVAGCNRNSRLNNHLNYYTFPKERHRQEQWLRLVGRDDLIDKGELKSGYRVCSRHFSPNSMKAQSINLCSDAVPTLCLPSDGVDEDDPEPSQHNDIVCNSCQKPIHGFRYKCVSCDDYDLCPKCESMETHSHHYMLRIPRPLKFAIADQLIKKWRAFFKAEHVNPNCRESDSSQVDDSDDDEPITKYARSPDSGVDLSDDVKLTIREEIARVMALKSVEKRRRKKEKGQVLARKRSGVDLVKPSKRPRSDSQEPASPPPAAAAPEVAFADVNDMCDVKNEAPTVLNAGPELDKPLMHMRLSDDLTQLVIEIAGEPSKTVYY